MGKKQPPKPGPRQQAMDIPAAHGQILRANLDHKQPSRPTHLRHRRHATRNALHGLAKYIKPKYLSKRIGIAPILFLCTFDNRSTALYTSQK
jgi:hypothetical protein